MNAATSSSRRTRVLLSTAAIVAGSTLLAGCQVISPRQTDVMYDAGDGVSIDVGDVEIRNLVVVSEKAGGPGVLSGAVGNPTDTPMTLTFAAKDDAGTVTGTATAQIPAHATVDLSADGPKVTLPAVAPRPGAMVLLTVSSPSAGDSPVEVPILTPVGYYADFAPGA
ncbi:hypothetical protein [Nostocoides sp.]|uniref:hypothetical protein n=1 Tax=Nostocoides sp. TaxID=1917966 RepID=UPI002C84D661|nr:hypothetical protein [Tetrasphaera sp.]